MNSSGGISGMVFRIVAHAVEIVHARKAGPYFILCTSMEITLQQLDRV